MSPSTAARNDRFAGDARQPAFLHPGGSTAMGINVEYRLNKLRELGILRGIWLDCGCADGGYTVALTRFGADGAIGVDPDPERIAAAANRNTSNRVAFRWCDGNTLPFPDNAFDGVFMNEVLEHVLDEDQTLREIQRVLKPDGHLAVISPNRWFPFEGHGMRIFGKDVPFPVPILPWLPVRLTTHFMTARNYWPYELRNVVAKSGLKPVAVDYVLPVFELYTWLPRGVIRLYRRLMPAIEKNALLRKFGVSTFVLARKI